MSDLWGYNPSCDGDFCPYNCDKCGKADGAIEDEVTEDDQTCD